MTGPWYPPSWPADEWDTVTLLLEESFKTPPGQEWNDRKAKAYGLMLDGYDPGAVIEALQRLASRGQTFLPSVGDVIGAITLDVTVPAWTEAYDLLMRATRRGCRVLGSDQVVEDAIVAVLADQHPYLAAFAGMVGGTRLRYTQFDDPDDGKWELKRLREEWEQFVERADGRRREGRPIELDAPAQRRELHRPGPRQIDPAALLGAPAESGT